MPDVIEPSSSEAQGVQESPAKGLSAWQSKLLPLMVRMLVSLTAFFFIITLAQLAYLHWEMRQKPQLEVAEFLANLEPEPDARERLQAERLKAAIYLEAHIIERRYQQATVLLMARTWVRYLGFVTGMTLALVGAVFILGKLREAPSEVSAKSESLSLNLKSASPGLMLAGFGLVLMTVTIVTHHEITVRDSSTYFAVDGELKDDGEPKDEVPPELDDPNVAPLD